MFGMGGSEMLVILVIALLFLGPDKLPEVTKAISKGVRDLKKQSRALQQTIENDEHIGGAIRDLKSALRGDEIPVRPKKKPALAIVDGEAKEAKADEHPPDPDPSIAYPELAKPAVTLPATAGEADPSVPEDHDTPAELAAMIKPAAGTVAQGSTAEASPPTVKPEHG